METLILAPLREIASLSNKPGLQGAIIIDGLDECEAEQYHDTTKAEPRPRPSRENEQDQLEILQVLRVALLTPSFPFCILVTSRPERIFREFFDTESNSVSFLGRLIYTKITTPTAILPSTWKLISNEFVVGIV